MLRWLCVLMTDSYNEQGKYRRTEHYFKTKKEAVEKAKNSNCEHAWVLDLFNKVSDHSHAFKSVYSRV